jgi:hypothetical protein
VEIEWESKVLRKRDKSDSLKLFRGLVASYAPKLWPRGLVHYQIMASWPRTLQNYGLVHDEKIACLHVDDDVAVGDAYAGEDFILLEGELGAPGVFNFTFDQLN